MISINPSTLARTVSLFRPEYLSTLWIDFVCQSVQYIHLSCCSGRQQRKITAIISLFIHVGYPQKTYPSGRRPKTKAFSNPYPLIVKMMAVYTPQFRQTSFVSSREDLSTISSAILFPQTVTPPCSQTPLDKLIYTPGQQENLLTCVRAKECDTWLTNTCRSFPLRSQLSMRSRCASTQYILKAQGKR